MRVLASPATTNRAHNPYNWMLYTEVRALGVEVDDYTRARLLTRAYDVWHLHWPESSLNEPAFVSAAVPAVRLLGMMGVARRTGVRLVWTIHNTVEHERRHPRLARWFWKAFVKRVDACISLTAAGDREAVDRFPVLASLPRFVIPHGHYRDAYPPAGNRQAARIDLGLASAQIVVGFVGQIREYKNVPALVDAFGRLRDDSTTLIVAGDPRPKPLAAAVQRAAEPHGNVRLSLGFLSNEHLVRAVTAANLLVFPFRELNSGSALLALSFNRPILVPDTPQFLELQREVGEHWVLTYQGEVTADVLRDAVARVKRLPAAGRPCLDAFAWSRVAADTVEAYRRITASPAAVASS